MKTTQKFARLCEVKKTGMNTGYVFHDGLFECEDESDALAYAIGEGYPTLAMAYDDEVYYYTEWEECDDTWYEQHDGVWYECDENGVVEAVSMPMKSAVNKPLLEIVTMPYDVLTERLAALRETHRRLTSDYCHAFSADEVLCQMMAREIGDIEYEIDSRDQQHDEQ